MLNHLRQKKKKEAVRRLSHGPDGRTSVNMMSGRGSTKRTMEAGTFRVQRRRIGAEHAGRTAARGAKQVHPSPLLAANPSPQQFGPADPLSSTAPTFGTAGVFSTSQGSVFGGQGVPVSTAGIFSTSQGSAFGGQGAHMSQQTPGKGNETAPTSIFSSAGSNASSFGVGPSLANSTAGTASGSNTSSSTGAFGSTFGSGVVGPGTFGVPSSQTEQVSSSVGPAFPTSAVTSGSTAPLSFGGAPAGAGSFSFGNKPNPEPQTSDSSTGLLLKPSGFGSFSSPTGTGESSGFGGFTAAPETKLPAFGQSSGNSFAPPSFPSASLGSGISSNKTTGVFGQATSPTSPGNVADKFGTLSTALVIREIPEVLNKNAWIKRFYSRFGEVVKVVCYAHKKSATVTFKTHEAAEKAKKKGKILKSGQPPVAIFWKMQGSRKSSSEDSPPKHSKSSITSSPDKGIRSAAKFSKEERGAETCSRTVEQSNLARSSLPLARTSGERFRVLEAIEKKIRQGMKKQSDISSARAVQGTCPDMCPEKERYMREEQRRLTVFEIIPGTDGSIEENPQVDHRRAVKEYDRSAADKEEPLPHDLRPVPVLHSTMDYLACHVMDNHQHSRADWFEFLWNRTRAIRKDITQQHLCNPECADLVEKTARFHVFCAHFLCEEPMNAFDPKINTENLTKCLQTLKQFYDDLYKNKGAVCPCEAEFRAYDILLNLNEGDILRQVMCYRPEVRQSPEVKFATKVFNALNSNNFVRFFKLVRETNYLSACLIHRYFAQVRAKALRTLNTALSIPNRTVSFPLKDLASMLGFEDSSEAAEFSSFHGLSTDGECVSFSRNSFVEPESKVPQRKGDQLIESKRGCSIGEVVYNGQLPPSSIHEPTSSFNEAGQYVGAIHVRADRKTPPPPSIVPSPKKSARAPAAVSAPVPQSSVSVFGQSASQTFTQTVTRLPLTGFPPPFSAQYSAQVFAKPAEPVQPVEPAQPSIVYSGEEIKECTKKLFLEVLNEMVAELTKESMEKVRKLLKFSAELAQELQEKLVAEFIAETAKSTLEGEVREKRLAQERKEERQRNAVAIFCDVTNTTIDEECRKIAQEDIRAAHREALEKARQRACAELSVALTGEAVSSELRRLASELIREEKSRRDAALQLLRRQLERARLQRYYGRWLKAYRARIHVRNLLSTFPPAAPLLSPAEQVQALLPGTDPPLIRVSSLRTVTHKNEIRDALQSRQTALLQTVNEACEPLDIPQLLVDSLRTHPVALRERCLAPGSPLYWKLLISVPGDREGVDPNTFEPGVVRVSPSLIEEKFKRKSQLPEADVPSALQNKVELLSLYGAEVRRAPFKTSAFAVCTKAVRGVLTNTEMNACQDSRQFCGANALLFVMNRAELKEVRPRLTRVLQSKPRFPALPVLVLVAGRDADASWSDDAVGEALGISELRRSGWVSDCRIVTLDKFSTLDHFNDKMAEVLMWLGSNASFLTELHTDTLANFVEEGLQSWFFAPVYEDMALRKKAHLEQQCPEVIVHLYNTLLGHLAEAVTSNRLRSVSWPITEFAASDVRRGLPDVTWSSPEKLQASADAILALRLPDVPAAVDDTWASESKLCEEFVKRIGPQNGSLMNRVKWLLDRAKRSVEEVNFLSGTPLAANQVPWAQIIDACVSSMLTSLHLDPGRSESEVHFFAEDRDKFVFPDQWRVSINLSKQEVAKADENKRRKSRNPTKSRSETLHDSWMEVENDLRELDAGSVRPMPPVQMTPSLREMNGRLSEAVEEAKRETQRFDDFLLEALATRDSPIRATPTPERKRRMSDLSTFTKASPSLAAEGISLPSPDTSFSCVEDSLVGVRNQVKFQRRSDEFAEWKLKKLLAS